MSSRSASRCLRITRVARRRPSSVSSRWRSPSTVSSPSRSIRATVWRDRRAALVQPLGDPGAQRDDALLDQLVDGPEVHLGGVDQVAHRPHSVPHGVNRAGMVVRDATPSCGSAATCAWPTTRPCVEACADGDVLPLFVLDPALWGPAGPGPPRLPRRLAARPRRLAPAAAAPAARCVRGDPGTPGGAGRAGGRRRRGCTSRPTSGPTAAAATSAVEQALAEHGIELVRTGSPYAVAPGRVTNGSGEPYQVFTPFSRAWADHGWRGPVDAPTGADWLDARRHHRPPRRRRCPDGLELPEAGEAAARRRWRGFLDDRVAAYDADRDRPGLDATSHMSVHLKWGEIHPARCSPTWPGCAAPAPRRTAPSWPGGSSTPTCCSSGPETAREYLRPEFARMAYDEPGGQLEAWRDGRTGFPIVDAGMRQLRARAGCTTGCG